jgi:hypothetical protein
MGLGPYPHVPLALARDRASTYRTQLKRDRVDPLAARQTKEAENREAASERAATAAKRMSFKDDLQRHTSRRPIVHPERDTRAQQRR